MLHAFRDLTFRPAHLPGIRSPLTVRSTGHYRLGTRPEINPGRPFTQLFWVMTGEVLFHLGDSVHACPAEHGFWYGSGEPHRIYPGTPSAEYYWVTFDGSLVGDWLLAEGAGRKPWRAGPCPVSLFEEIQRTIGLPSVLAERRAAELGLRMLMAFVDPGGSGEESSPNRDELLCREMEARISQGFRDPDYGIEQVASQLGVHRTTLFRLYRSRRGITPSAYLQRQRLQYGLELLGKDPRNITEIALASGYRDPNYFAKVIRRATGETPRRVRTG